MFNDQNLEDPTQNYMDPNYNMSHLMNQYIYNTNYNVNIYQNYIYPVGTFENENATSIINLGIRQADEKILKIFS